MLAPVDSKRKRRLGDLKTTIPCIPREEGGKGVVLGVVRWLEMKTNKGYGGGETFVLGARRETFAQPFRGTVLPFSGKLLARSPRALSTSLTVSSIKEK